MTDRVLLNVLVDTSVWIDHLRARDPVLEQLLEAERVYRHPMILAELACGNLPARQRVLGQLEQLPGIPIAGSRDVLRLIESRRLFGRGVGLIDVHLLASTLLLPGTGLLSRDCRLAAVARDLSIDSNDTPLIH